MSVQRAIESLLQEGVNQEHFPGAHYHIVYRDRPSIHGYVGYVRTHPKKEELTGSEIYDVASLTKVISTTTIIMKLIEQHQCSLQAKVVEFLPNFKHRDITIYHLLTHTSGLPADIPRANTLQNKDDVLSHIFEVDLIHPVGTKIVYSDIGFIILGLIIQKITKKVLYIVAEELIFQPLQMHHTSYHPTPSQCAPTELREDHVFNGYLQGLVHDEKSFALGGNAGHAGLFSTTADIARFIDMFLQEDETVLSKRTMDDLFVARAFDTNPNGYPLIRALGWDKPTPGGTSGDYTDLEQTIVHTGFTGCNMWIDRAHGVGFVMLSNAVHPKRNRNGIIPYRKQIANLIMKDKEEHEYEKNR